VFKADEELTLPSLNRYEIWTLAPVHNGSSRLTTMSRNPNYLMNSLVYPESNDRNKT